MTLPVLTTERLTLRPLAMSDAPAVVAAMSDWEVVRWLSAPPYPYTRADAEYFIENFLDDSWAIDDGSGLIGVIGVKGDLGYWLVRAYHGRGYMPEAARAVVADYFSATDEPLVSGYFVGNSQSRSVLRGLGFADTHIADTYARPLDREVRIQRMRLTKESWVGRDA